MFSAWSAWGLSHSPLPIPHWHSSVPGAEWQSWEGRWKAPPLCKTFSVWWGLLATPEAEQLSPRSSRYKLPLSVLGWDSWHTPWVHGKCPSFLMVCAWPREATPLSADTSCPLHPSPSFSTSPTHFDSQANTEAHASSCWVRCFSPSPS